MKRILMAALAVAGSVAWALPAGAAESRVVLEGERTVTEVGVMGGWPTGLSAKSWMSENTAGQVGIAWNPAASGFALSADYLTHSKSLTDSPRIYAPVYVGLGGRVVQYESEGRDPITVGPRLPIGAAVMLKDFPISAFVEVAPAIEVGRGADPVIVGDASIGARAIF